MQLDEKQQKLRKKFFPRAEWTDQGPVRRVYLTCPADGSASSQEALAALADRAGFAGPGQQCVTGGAAQAWDAFERRADGGSDIALIFGTEADAIWCDIVCCPADEDGWQRTIIRSEEGENLVALAHAEGVLRFRRAE